MNTLREAAQAVVDQWDAPNWKLTVHTGVLIDRLRAALSAPDDAEPVMWMNRYGATMKTRDRVTANAMGFTIPLYARPPRDEWRPASEPPDTPPHDYLLKKLAMVMPLFEEARDALTAISEQQRAVRCISPTLADRMDAAGTYSIDDWRDVQPPTEGSK